MPQTPKLPTLKGQFITCLLFCTIAVAVTLTCQKPIPFRSWKEGLPAFQQLAVALIFALTVAIGSTVVLFVPRFRKAALRLVPPSLSSFHLSGTTALTMALSAGVGEELLFRAALQPLLGLWLASVVFALAHVRTAILAGSTSKKVIYIANVFVVGIGLGLVFQYLGLLTAVLFHVIFDLAALLSLRILQSAKREPLAT